MIWGQGTGRNREPTSARRRPKAEMAMRARWLSIAAVVSGALAMALPAAAGGSWLETEKKYYPPGDQVTARGTFGPGQLEGQPSDGPYEAYMVPGFRLFQKPGPVPQYAIPIGTIAINPATGNYCCWVASLTFTVPDVPPGRYTIDYCNVPCTVNGMGDLMGGSFFVGENEEQARLMARIERLERKAEALNLTKRDLRKAEARLTEVQERYGRLRAARPAEEPAPVERTMPSDRPVSAWAVLAALMVLAGGAWFRKRLERTAIPDVVPDELVREVEAQVPSRQPMTSRGSPAMSMPAPPFTKS
jgi:hypothetical protein